ncbi:MAG: hypothetical protein ACI4UE_03185 [Candidatus Scatovivens sp.]
MANLKNKLIVLIIVFILGIVALQVSAYATNENIEIIKKSNEDYLIYIKDNLNKDFEFAFSNDKEGKDLNFDKKAGLDSDPKSANANKIAYVNSLTIGLFNKPTYMWAKDENGYIIEGVEIDLNKAISATSLEEMSNITKTIPVNLEQTNTTEEEVDGKKIITTVGKVVLENTDGKYQYVLVKLPNSEEYDELLSLLTRISKFNDETDMYTKISVFNKFNSLYESLKPTSESDWTDVVNNEILQPSDSKNGEQYVLWLKEENKSNTKIDIQLLTCNREESEEKIVEKITTKLPVTYDNNVLLVVLAVLIIAIIVVSLRIRSLNKKEEK